MIVKKVNIDIKITIKNKIIEISTKAIINKISKNSIQAKFNKI